MPYFDVHIEFPGEGGLSPFDTRRLTSTPEEAAKRAIKEYDEKNEREPGIDMVNGDLEAVATVTDGRGRKRQFTITAEDIIVFHLKERMR